MNILCETLNKCYELVRGFHFTMRLKISLAIETGEAHKAFSPEVIVPSSQDEHPHFPQIVVMVMTFRLEILVQK